MSRVILIIAIAICTASMVLNLYVSITLTKVNDLKLQKLEQKYKNLVKERGQSWEQTAGTPDAIYLITFNADTVWYWRVGDKSNLP